MVVQHAHIADVATLLWTPLLLLLLLLRFLLLLHSTITG